MFEGFIGALGFLLFWCIPIWAIIWFFKNKLVERGPGIKKQEKPYQPGLFDRLFDKIWCPIPPFSWIAPW